MEEGSAKGQVISKCLFDVFNFYQKTKHIIRLYYYDTSGQLVFVCFLREIEDTKKTFQNYLAFKKLCKCFGLLRKGELYLKSCTYLNL